MRPILTPLILVPLLLGASVAQGAGIQTSSEKTIYLKESSEINTDESHRNREDEDSNETIESEKKISKHLILSTQSSIKQESVYNSWPISGIIQEEEPDVDNPITAEISKVAPNTVCAINAGYLTDDFIHFATRPE